MFSLGLRIYELVNEKGEPIENVSVINVGGTKAIFGSDTYEIRYVEISIREEDLFWRG